ncbi:sucrase-isomaltase, intestinal-like [Oppia nitens]|uniref:sucrase-isomaltase, intestinal-like n=1 Tax=Oppia nitens TaxID=1686743 RepID=UPI0023D97CEA|nr:sucrase-isomaltase, intestinal-like [Oppia nitens]
MGENTHHSLRHDFTNYKTYPLFTQDRATGDEQFNYYGVHPFYTCLESDGQSHGILYLSSNAMEYTLLPEPGLSFKTLGGVLDMFVFVGDSPGHVIELYTSLIGRPILPPFWGLGYQLTRWGFKNTDDLRAVIDRNQKANVPLDVMYMDIDYMDQYHDFSYNRQSFAGLPQLIHETKLNDNLHWTLILDPAIEAVEKDNPVFMDGYNRDVYVKWDKSIAKQDRYNPPNVPSDRDVLYGKVWPRGPAAFPDFFKNVTHEWWIRWVGQLHKDLQFDALWIDMNEPANQNDQIYHCPQNKYDYPAVRTKALYGNGVRELGHKTLCMTTKQGDHNEYLHYDVHSLYGLTETMATQKAIHAATGKRGFAVSRSTYVSSGRYGTHWLGDNFSVWDNMKFSIIGILEFNMFGINFVGPDICGFLSNTTPELCKRWHQLGAFYPFSRNHNCIGNRDQDPASWITAGHPEVTDAMKVAFSLRYKLLPYFYTLFYKGHTRGQTVARPLFHEFPTDNNTHSIDEQFMFGPAVLVSPFLYEGQKQVKAYLPDTNTVWYDLNLNQSKPGYVVIDDNGMIPVHLRGGYILPISSEPNHVNTRTVREGGLNLLVLPDQSGRAVGDFFWDDGDSIDTIEKLEYNYYTFSLENNTLDLTVEKLNYKTKQLIKLIEIVSSSEGQTWTVTLDGKPLPLEVKVHGGVAQIPVNIDLIGKSVGEKWSLKWKPAF